MDELLETLDDTGTPLGPIARSEVHARGLLHRAVHVWVFTPDRRVYVQQRGLAKDINPGRWDVSVGEHLQPGEDYATAARRGLHEELGIDAGALETLGGVRRVSLDRPAQGIHDHELQQAFRLVHAGHVVPAADELAELQLLEPGALRRWLAHAPDDFTAGVHRDVADLGLLAETG